MRVEPSDLLRGPDSNCALLALWNALPDRSEEAIYKAAMKCGFNETFGMKTFMLRKALKKLKVESREITEIFKAWENGEALNLGKVQAAFNTGTYLVAVNGHVLTLREGEILDPNHGHPGRARHVVRLIEILPSKK